MSDQFTGNTDPRLTLANRQTGTAYTLTISDSFGIVEMSNAAANVLTVPTNASVPFPIGMKIKVSQYDVGATSIAFSGGVTNNSPGGKTQLASQYTIIELLKTGTDEWYIDGQLI